MLSEAPKYNVTSLLSSADPDSGGSVKLLTGIRKSCWASLGNDLVPGPGPAAPNSGVLTWRQYSFRLRPPPTTPDVLVSCAVVELK